MNEASSSVRHLDQVRAAIADPTLGLPQDVFDFVRQVTPLINVDLLIRDAAGAVLLAWRDDDFYVGWHVPGGIIRFRETMASRIEAVARLELGATVTAEASPCDVLQQCHHRRGHFISLLFACMLVGRPTRAFARFDEDGREAGALRWFDAMPPDIIAVHRGYARWFPRTPAPVPRSSDRTSDPADDRGLS